MNTKTQSPRPANGAHTPTLEQIRVGIRDEQFKDREGRESRCNMLADALWVREQEHASLLARVAELEGALRQIAALETESEMDERGSIMESEDAFATVNAVIGIARATLAAGEKGTP